jgi:hypothetical protein
MANSYGINVYNAAGTLTFSLNDTIYRILYSQLVTSVPTTISNVIIGSRALLSTSPTVTIIPIVCSNGYHPHDISNITYSSSTDYWYVTFDVKAVNSSINVSSGGVIYPCTRSTNTMIYVISGG